MVPSEGQQSAGGSPAKQWFTTTHWSVVLAAKQSSSPDGAAALELLCRTYWYPLYAYVRRQGYSPEDAQDLTQAFFEQFLEKGSVQLADRGRGKFRSFLLTSLKHFLTHEWEKARTLKRGGGHVHLSWDQTSAESQYQLEPVSELKPEKIFDQRWALALFQQALARLRQEYAATGKAPQFEELKAFLTDAAEDGGYAEVAARLDMPPRSVAVAVHRMRQRYGELVREEIAHTVASRGEIQEELRYLIELVGGSSSL
ncbi:MAG TPA: sigma-70 family RNA polymerase sigma factor [Verrucomicrobiae bacterium]|jgi:DNA-directed RNA polymerase specialized sigma24 family protein|nr:sigma-70 family RNA polymerase sigma factor [Verrucomicrobiae bacterium]